MTTRATLIIFGCVLLTPVAAAQPPQPKKEADESAIRALLTQLGDESFEKREDAEKKLIALGKLAAPLVKKTTRESSDAEVRERATRVLRALAQFSTVNFQALTNQKLKDPLAGGAPGNTLDLSPGKHRFLSVPFQVGESLLQVGSTKLLGKPAKIGGIPVGRKLSSLHFLHATHWALEKEAIVGSYIVHYADGSSATIPIIYGKDITGWWKYPSHKAPSMAQVAWQGKNPAADGYGATIWLVLSTWKNPRLDTAVSKIDFASTMDTQCAPFCVAITAEESAE